MLVPERISVPVPALVKSKAPLTMPLTVRALAELLFQVWFAPNATLALMVRPAAPESTVIPVPPLAMRVSVLPPMVTKFVLVGAVPRIWRLLIVKSWPSVVLKFVPLSAAKVTSLVEPGVPVLLAVPAWSVYQLVKLPLIWFQFPPRLPLQ